jgi:ketosteroid isomerase-like protein
MPGRAWTAVAPVLAAVLWLSVMAEAKQQSPGSQQPGMPRGQKHESRHEIDQMEEDWRQAVLKGNSSQMAGLLAEDYLAITPSGTLQTRDQALANMREGVLRLTTLEISDRKVRFYGTTALVTSVAEVQGTTGDGPINGSFRYTRVYVRNSAGAWKVVSFEASRIRQPGEPREYREPHERK